MGGWWVVGGFDFPTIESALIANLQKRYRSPTRCDGDGSHSAVESVPQKKGKPFSLRLASER